MNGVSGAISDAAQSHLCMGWHLCWPPRETPSHEPLTWRIRPIIGVTIRHYHKPIYTISEVPIKSRCVTNTETSFYRYAPIYRLYIPSMP
jgi:hypothetical protein